MLTPDPHGSFEVWTERPDGTRFNEHAVKVTPGTDREPSLTECWLESEDDQVFQIRLRKTAQCPRALYDSAWECKRHVDGRPLPGAALLAGYTARNDGITWRQAAVETARGVQLYELQFKAHELTSEARDVSMNPAAMAKLGLIELTLVQGTHTKAEMRVLAAWKNADQGPVLEGQKKLGSKITGVNPVPAYKTPSYWFNPLIGAPKHKFIFKYRTRVVLELMNVIEATPAQREDGQDQQVEGSIPTSTAQGRKRRRDSIDPSPLVSPESSEPDEDADLKPLERLAIQEKRIKWLESQLAHSKKHKAMDVAATQVVDLTAEDD